MSDVINAHDLGVAGGYIIEAAMQGDIDQLKAENDKLREDVDRLIQAVEDLHDVSLEDSLVQMENENARLREYVTKLEVANLDVTARLTDYIGQYDPTDAFMAEVKAENAKLREELADAPKCETCEAMLDCDECLRADGSHKECRRLRADNAKLREEVVDLRKSSQTYESENAELRELVRKVLQFERAGCEGCPYASTCDVDCLYEPNCPMREDIERDMRELEVDACPNCGAKVVEPTTNDVDAEVDG